MNKGQLDETSPTSSHESPPRKNGNVSVLLVHGSYALYLFAPIRYEIPSVGSLTLLIGDEVLEDLQPRIPRKILNLGAENWPAPTHSFFAEKLEHYFTQMSQPRASGQSTRLSLECGREEHQRPTHPPRELHTAPNVVLGAQSALEWRLALQ